MCNKCCIIIFTSVVSTFSISWISSSCIPGTFLCWIIDTNWLSRCGQRWTSCWCCSTWTSPCAWCICCTRCLIWYISTIDSSLTSSSISFTCRMIIFTLLICSVCVWSFITNSWCAWNSWCRKWTCFAWSISSCEFRTRIIISSELWTCFWSVNTTCTICDTITIVIVVCLTFRIW